MIRMKTQIEQAKNGILTPQMKRAARYEGMDEEVIRARVADGSVVLMIRDDIPTAIGYGCKTKINVNLGTSSASINPAEEVEKAIIAERFGADTVSDLSMGGDIRGIRKSIFENTKLPITTVPVYQTVIEQGMMDMTCDDILDMLKQHVKEGVSSVVLHCIEKAALEMLKKQGRTLGMVSKGGSFTSVYMLSNGVENPFIENFAEVLEILRSNDVVLSLGNTMRSGCIHDLQDGAQMQEVNANARLAASALDGGVQTIIEGIGGHVQAAHIIEYVQYHKQSSPAPLFVAGPLPTDIALGHDHIAGAVGASMASGAGADYLCYITPAEHLKLPSPEQVKEGLIAFRIAAHIGDSMKYGVSNSDYELAKCRARMDWDGQLEYAIDCEKPKSMSPAEGPCTMCGEYCAIKIMRQYLFEEE